MRRSPQRTQLPRAPAGTHGVLPASRARPAGRLSAAAATLSGLLPRLACVPGATAAAGPVTPERVAGVVAAARPLLLAAILVCGAPAADAADLREVAGLVAWLPLPALPASPPAIGLAGAAG